MAKNILRQMFMIWLVLGLAACKTSYQINAPVADTVHTTPPAEFRVGYNKAPTALPKMVLNGSNVEQFFTAGTTEAIANGADLAPFLKEGQNRFHVNPPLGPMVYFVYETAGPEIVILRADGTDPVAIQGLAVDAVGTQSVQVNGVAATLAADGSFTATVPAASLYTFQAVDTYNHASTTEYAALAQQYNPSLQFRVNQAGLDFALGQVVNAINGTDLSGVMGAEPLFDETWKGAFGETYGSDAFIDSISLSANSISLDLADGGQNQLAGDISTAHMVLRLRIHNGLLPPTEITIGATVGPLDLAGNLQLGVTDHTPVVTLSNFSFNVGAVVLDDVPSAFASMLSPIISGIVNLFQGLISNILEDVLTDKLGEVIAQVIQESYTLRINDLDMAMQLQLEDIATSDASMLVTMSGGVTPITVNPLIPPQLGPLHTSDNVSAPVEDDSHFAVSINANVINQTLVSAFQVGLTQLNIVGETLQFGLPRNDELNEVGTQRVLVDTLAPPQLRVDRVDGAAKTTLGIHGLTMGVQTRTDTGFKNEFRVRLNAKVEVAIATNPDNTLNLSMVSNPVIDITGIAIGNNELSAKLYDSVVETFATYAIGQVMEALAQPLGAIKLPSFNCMAFISQDVQAIGDEGHHLGLSGTLSKVSDECDNPVGAPPKVAYSRGVGTPMICSADEDYDAGLCYQKCEAGYTGVGPVCWKDNASYGRGVGSAASLMCGAGQEMDAGLCYTPCKSGFHGVGPVCYNNQPASYGRGVGTIPNLIPYSCPAGKEMDAGLCYVYCSAGYHGVGPVCWLDEPSYGRGVGTVPSLACGSGQELDAGLCYPVCDSGYHGVGPVCWTNDELSYGRGVGAPIHTCEAGKEEDAGLCYKTCAEGYDGVGPVCWPNE